MRDWLRGKFILIFHNQIRFDTQIYGKGAVVKESRLIYYPVSSQVSEIFPLKVQKTDIELHDFDLINLDKLTMYGNRDLFGLKQISNRSYEGLKSNWVSVTIEMSLNLNQVERNVFTMFDMLSDIGGLSGILMSVFAITASIWNYLAYDNHLVSHLFTVRSEASTNLENRG